MDYYKYLYNLRKGMKIAIEKQCQKKKEKERIKGNLNTIPQERVEERRRETGTHTEKGPF